MEITFKGDPQEIAELLQAIKGSEEQTNIVDIDCDQLSKKIEKSIVGRT